MLSLMEVIMVRNLAERGVGISGIARELGVDRKTVRKILLGGGRDEGAGRQREVSSVLDPFKDFIRARLDVAEFTAQRLFQDIEREGYRGSYDVVRRFVAPLREEKTHRAVMRFETLPGQQAQADWGGKFGFIDLDGVQKRLWCFSMVLGFSRRQYIEFTVSRDLVTFFSCHIHAFEYFGAVPREILYDNLKTAVLANVDGVVEFLPKFLDFASYYGFTPRACRPYRARTKGKVERPFPYIRTSFFMGRTFKDLTDVNAEARGWLDTIANVRIHGTTYERPVDRFEKERAYLRPLPERSFPAVDTVYRSSTRDCVVSYGGNFYSVPHRYAARRGLRLEVGASRVRIYHRDELIAEHTLCRGKHHRIMDPKHLEGLMPEKCVTPLQRRLEELRRLGPLASQFIDGLVRTQTRFLPWHARRLEETLEKMGPELLQNAMEQAMRFEAFDSRTVQNICHKERLRHPSEPTLLGNILARVLTQSGLGEVQLRDLREYDRTLSEEG